LDAVQSATRALDYSAFNPSADSSKGGFVNRFDSIRNSGLARNIGLTGLAMLAAVYTVPRVDSWVRLFATDPRVKSRFALWLDRKSTYEPMISAKLEQHDMPQDLIYLAMIESGFNPKAKSPAKAGGLWQFISETGQRYGLTVNRHVDERNQPAKATDAALAYLSDLYDRFGSWYLAAAAYNTGENRVARIMRQVTGSEKGTDADYYRISKLLPKETQDYVPMMIAAARISKNPAKYGFSTGDSAAN
jgi:membrane-bound lytic murein transglycosylase D